MINSSSDTASRWCFELRHVAPPDQGRGQDTPASAEGKGSRNGPTAHVAFSDVAGRRVGSDGAVDASCVSGFRSHRDVRWHGVQRLLAGQDLRWWVPPRALSRPGPHPEGRGPRIDNDHRAVHAPVRDQSSVGGARTVNGANREVTFRGCEPAALSGHTRQNPRKSGGLDL